MHPKALLNMDGLPPEIRESVEKRIAGYDDPVNFYVEKLVEGISTLAAAFWPEEGHRAPVGLQVQRIRQPDRRQAV